MTSRRRNAEVTLFPAPLGVRFQDVECGGPEEGRRNRGGGFSRTTRNLGLRGAAFGGVPQGGRWRVLSAFTRVIGALKSPRDPLAWFGPWKVRLGPAWARTQARNWGGSWWVRGTGNPELSLFRRLQTAACSRGGCLGGTRSLGMLLGFLLAGLAVWGARQSPSQLCYPRFPPPPPKYLDTVEADLDLSSARACICAPKSSSLCFLIS